MVYDSIERLALWLPRCTKAAEFAVKTDFASLPDGRVELGDGIYANIQTYTANPPDFSRFEAHRKFADVQFLVGDGYEDCGICIPTASLDVNVPYDEEKDILFGAADVRSFVRLTRRNFALFLPDDAHMPGRRLDSAAVEVRKCVIKIPVELTLQNRNDS